MVEMRTQLANERVRLVKSGLRKIVLQFYFDLPLLIDRAFMISRPQLFNTDQGTLSTSSDSTGRFEQHWVTAGMDGC